MIAGIIIGVVVLILVIFVISSYNGLVKKKIAVEEAFSTMDVYLKKRFDLIPNLVETVKGYAKHEEETLAKVVALRNENYSGMSDEEKIANSAAISRAIPQIMALAEAYPDLKANQNFMELSAQLEAVEDDIANSRKYYNGAVKRYNTAVQTVPSNIIAGMFHFEKKPMFEVDGTEERKNVQVKFE
ncbi:MAG: LemA family protein [Lachnospiraceae bacterium]|nr:LemA family protein [Lachnospiraceae bacterium]